MAQNVIITKAARSKMVKARAGAITLPKIVGMAFGSGGVDGSGQVAPPSENQAALNNEVFRKAVDGYEMVGETTCRYACKLAETELAGVYISEIGLYDEDGDIVCIKTFTPKGKDNDLEMSFTIDDVF